MKSGKWKWKLLLFLGSVPFMAALYVCVDAILLHSGEGEPMSFGEILLIYSYMYWPTYVIGIILIVLSVVKVKKKH